MNALDVLYAQLTRDLFAIAKFLFYIISKISLIYRRYRYIGIGIVIVSAGFGPLDIVFFTIY